MYKEETDSEPEILESQDVPEEEEDIDEEKRGEATSPKRKKKIFDYLNKDAKRNMR